ncbi:integrase core domain-containing protein [Glutamicibacter ardleyensis]|uniref:integrase core domain-containing protein n=1 Tax=Glutamicibacter ardleyensis TaxID=225894 RepID=UPI003FD4F0A3
MESNRQQDLEGLCNLITRYREHYNRRRPHQTLNQSTPERSWQALEHTPATEPIPLFLLEAKAAEYLSKRNLKHIILSTSNFVVSKTGVSLPADLFSEPVERLSANQVLVEVMRKQRKVLYKRQHISVPASLAGRQYCRTVTDDEFVLPDPDTGEVVMSFPLPMTAMY